MADELYPKFPSIPRIFRTCVVTEKIDGTNAMVHISDDGQTVRAGSRTRWIEPGKGNDNFGFALWVSQNAEELKTLGPGMHYGEWWGLGIQRGYDLHERRFSLFNTARWSDDAVRPKCCHVVPVIAEMPFSTVMIETCLNDLEQHGSYAVPGFMKPEGICIFHEAARSLFKATLGGDGHKGA